MGEQRYWVNIYNGEGETMYTSIECNNPMDGQAKLAQHDVAYGGYDYAYAICYRWVPDMLPEEQWRLDIR